MQVRDILEASRDRLGDIDGTGWTDDRLIRLIDSAQKDICKTTSIYRKKSFIALANFNTLYSLPNDCYNITRVEYKNAQLPIYSREDIDSTLVKPDLYAIKSNINRGLIEIHPAFEELVFFDGYVDGTLFDGPIHIADQLGVASDIVGDICLSPNIGVATGIYDSLDENQRTHYGDISGSNLFNKLTIEGDNLGVLCGVVHSTKDNNYGFLSNINYNYVEGLYGICTGFVYDPNHITIYYTAIPPKVQWVNGALVIEDLWFASIVHYVVGYARQDDNDEGNYKLGELEIDKYRDEVYKAKKISAKSFNSQGSGIRQTIYRRF